MILFFPLKMLLSRLIFSWIPLFSMDFLWKEQFQIENAIVENPTDTWSLYNLRRSEEQIVLKFVVNEIISYWNLCLRSCTVNWKLWKPNCSVIASGLFYSIYMTMKTMQNIWRSDWNIFNFLLKPMKDCILLTAELIPLEATPFHLSIHE